MTEIPTPKLVLVNGSGILEVVTRGLRLIFLHLTSGSYETGTNDRNSKPVSIIDY